MFEQVFSILSNPPGSLVYHFLVLFSVEAALAMAFGQWLRERDHSTARLTIAMLVIGLSRAVLVAVALLAWQEILDRNLILPPVERSVDTLTALALMWAFVTMDDPIVLARNTFADILSAIGLLLVLAGSAYSAFEWFQIAGQGVIYNGLYQDFMWGVAQVGILTLGLLWMLFRVRYVYDAFLKAAILLIFIAAVALHLTRPPLTDIAAATRLGLAITMPMLAAVTYRHIVDKLLGYDAFQASLGQPLPMPDAVADAIRALPVAPESAQPEAPAGAPPVPGEAPPSEPLEVAGESMEEIPVPVPIGTEPAPAAPTAPALPSDDETIVAADLETLPPDLLREYPNAVHVVESLAGLVDSLDVEQAANRISRAVAAALRADVAAIISLDEESHRGDIVAAYDNIAQIFIEGGTLDLGEQPTMVNALGRLRQMRLTPQRNMRELRNFYKALQITHTGPAFIQPLHADEHRLGVLVVGSPYAKVVLSNAERTLLDRFGELVTKALMNAATYYDAIEKSEHVSEEVEKQLGEANARADVMEMDLESARKRADEMQVYTEDLERQLDLAKKSTEEQIAQAQESAQAQAQDSERVARLQRELDETRNAAQIELSALRMRLTSAAITQQEVAMLQEQLMSKAREVISLQTRLSEARATTEAAREQLRVQMANAADRQELERLQERIDEQKREIETLQTALDEAEASAGMAFEASQKQAEIEAAEAESIANLRAQLAERNALIQALEEQLEEKAKSTAMLQSKFGSVDDSLSVLEERLRTKTDELNTLQRDFDDMRAQAKERITALQEQLQDQDKVTARLGEVTAQLGVDKSVVDQLQREVAEKNAAVERLEGQLADANQSLTTLEEQLAATTAAVETAISEAQQVDSHDEVIASIAQELRSPMSSIKGYTELLLGESVGIIGALQRKFLQRVKASTERMESLLDNLVSVTTLDSGQLRLSPQSVNTTEVLEEAITGTVSQFQEKNLTLRLQIPDSLPTLSADRDAIHQVVTHLLTNASLATPVGGEVMLNAEQIEAAVPGPYGDDRETTCVHIWVTDAGPGIKPEDQERVFMRKYRADNPLIEGLGDTGVALSIARTLVESHGGRIWLESDPNVGTTFHVLLPVERLEATPE